MINKKDFESINKHALQEYPFECCGIITGDGKGNNCVHWCSNIQNKLHRDNPDDFPRDAKTAYYIDAAEMFKIISDTEKKEDKIVGFYHSHPDHDAYFSDTDNKMALFDNEPIYPEAVYIVVSIYDKKVKETKSFKWDDEKFLEVKI